MIAEVVEQRGRPRPERQGLLVSSLRLVVALSGVQDDAQQAKGCRVARSSLESGAQGLFRLGGVCSLELVSGLLEDAARNLRALSQQEGRAHEQRRNEDKEDFPAAGHDTN